MTRKHILAIGMPGKAKEERKIEQVAHVLTVHSLWSVRLDEHGFQPVLVYYKGHKGQVCMVFSLGPNWT